MWIVVSGESVSVFDLSSLMHDGGGPRTERQSAARFMC